MPRNNLKTARRAAGLTQQAVADKVGLSLREYHRIERGEIIGSIAVWDALEDMLGVNQRTLRENGDTRHAQAENP